MQATSVSTNVVTTKAEPVPPTQSTPPPEPEFEFADINALMCLLCARQFKSLDQLKRHNRESDLHKARSLSVVSYRRKLTSPFVLSFLLCGKSNNALKLYREIIKMPTYERWPVKKSMLERIPNNPSIVTGHWNGVLFSINRMHRYLKEAPTKFRRNDNRTDLHLALQHPHQPRQSILARILTTWVINCLR